MSKVILDEKRAKELSEEKAREIVEIYEKARKEIEQVIDDLGLIDSGYAPEIPEIDSQDRIAEDIEYALHEDESDRFGVKK